VKVGTSNGCHQAGGALDTSLSKTPVEERGTSGGIEYKKHAWPVTAKRGGTISSGQRKARTPDGGEVRTKVTIKGERLDKNKDGTAPHGRYSQFQKQAQCFSSSCVPPRGGREKQSEEEDLKTGKKKAAAGIKRPQINSREKNGWTTHGKKKKKRKGKEKLAPGWQMRSKKSPTSTP